MTILLLSLQPRRILDQYLTPTNPAKTPFRSLLNPLHIPPPLLLYQGAVILFYGDPPFYNHYPALTHAIKETPSICPLYVFDVENITSKHQA